MSVYLPDYIRIMAESGDEAGLRRLTNHASHSERIHAIIALIMMCESKDVMKTMLMEIFESQPPFVVKGVMAIYLENS